jgi:SAM-dependent methyltransferase
LNLGSQPLANNFTKTIDDQPEYPLAVVLCDECQHLQLDYFIDPDLMFKNYLYVSGTSKTYRSYLEWFAKYTGARKESLVLDIGCNDGTQLDAFKKLGADTWGIDPATNLYPMSSQRHKVILGYFDEKYKPGVKFDIINAQNVFAHNRDPLSFLSNCKKLMNDGSRLYIQTSQADMVLNGEFDTIYHEHINFFNVKSFKKLTERAELVLIDVIKTPIHGTSYMFTLGLNGEPSINVQNQIDIEAGHKLYNRDTYLKWSNNVLSLKNMVRRTLEGKFVVAYGAAAKGNTLLNFLKIKPEVIIDDNPKKHGTYSPGIKALIVDKNWILTIPKEKQISFLPLAWNFFDEIKSNILEVRNNPLDDFINLRTMFDLYKA